MYNDMIFSKQVYQPQGQSSFTDGLLGKMNSGPIGLPTSGKEWVDANFLQNVAGQQATNAAHPNVLQPQDAYFQMNSASPQENFQDELAQELRIADGSQPGAQAPPTVQSPQASAPDVAGAVTREAVTEATNNPQAGEAAGNVATAVASNTGTDAQGTQEVQASQVAQAQPNLAQGLLGNYVNTPAARYFYEQLARDYAKQLDAATLPARIAQYDANEAAIRRAHPDTVMGIQRQLIQGLEAAKAQYDQSKAAGDEKGMALSHQAAEQLRAQAQAIGFDLGDYGGNEDTNAMVQALANNDARAYAAIIDNDMAPEQYYQQLYNRARNSGMSRKESEGYAQAHTEQYQAERNARMQSAFYTYGLTNNGAITPYGMQILTKWAAGEDPQAFLGITTKAFGLPIDEYKLGNQRTLLSDQNKNKMEQNAQMHGFNMEELMKKIAGNLAGIELENKGKRDVATINGEYGLEAAKFRGSRSGGGDGSGRSSPGENLTPSQDKIINRATNLLNDVKTGNADPSELHDYVYSKEVSENLKPNDLDYVRSLDYAAQFYFYKNHGYDGGDSDSSDRAMYNACAHIANDTSEEWRDTFLPDYNFDDWVGVKPIE